MTTRKLFSALITIILLLTLAACGGNDLTGSWETELELSALGTGVTEPTSVAATMTFTFGDDGSGSRVTDDGTHPAAEEAFTYAAEGDTLTLTFDGGTEEYTYSLNGDTLTLTSPRTTLELNRKA